MPSRRDAAVLLIGNELLSGRVRDQNLGILAGQLWSLGVPLRRASVVGDSIEEIAAEARQLAERHDWVFTTGGVGPTHDDVTIAGIAAAFGVPVVSSELLEQRIRRYHGEKLKEAHLRLALIPQGAELVSEPAGSWPTVLMKNVWIFPGIPALLERKFGALADRFRQPPFHRLMLRLDTDESSIVPILDRAALEHSAVSIGSYPVESHVVLTFEGEDQQAVQAAAEHVDRQTAGIPRL